MERDRGQGAALKNEHVKMSLDFEYNIIKESTARRSDVTIEYKKRKVIHMACPGEKNVLEKNEEKKLKYQQFAFELKERRPGYRVEVIPIVIGCMSGRVGVIRERVKVGSHCSVIIPDSP